MLFAKFDVWLMRWKPLTEQSNFGDADVHEDRETMWLES